MINTFEDWVKDIVSSHKLCDEYLAKVDKSMSNKQLMDIVTDANGMSYLCEMRHEKHPLPYSVITSRFKPFINGHYVARHTEPQSGGEYDSKLYCQYTDDIVGDTTLLTLLGCKCNVLVDENHIIQIYLDECTSANISCPLNSKAIVHYWGKKPKYTGNVELVNESKHG